jgi:hypothetical protein
MVKPTGNIQSGRFVNCEDLRRKFRRDIRTYQKKELEDVILNDERQAQARPDTRRQLPDRTAVLSKYVTEPMELRAKYKGRVVRARVRRDGSIRFADKYYQSPSVAGAAACRRRTCNGWYFWKYQRAPGDWVLLHELRKSS